MFFLESMIVLIPGSLVRNLRPQFRLNQESFFFLTRPGTPISAMKL